LKSIQLRSKEQEFVSAFRLQSNFVGQSRPKINHRFPVLWVRKQERPDPVTGLESAYFFTLGSLGHLLYPSLN
jgi:hypothetical protein